MICSICEEVITADPYGWKGGCNAQPINNGTCCHSCDMNVVLPARLSEHGFKYDEIEAVLEAKRKDEEKYAL